MKKIKGNENKIISVDGKKALAADFGLMEEYFGL